MKLMSGLYVTMSVVLTQFSVAAERMVLLLQLVNLLIIETNLQ